MRSFALENLKDRFKQRLCVCQASVRQHTPAEQEENRLDSGSYYLNME